MKLRLPFSRQFRTESCEPPRGIEIRFTPILQQAQDRPGPDPGASSDGTLIGYGLALPFDKSEFQAHNVVTARSARRAE